MGRYICEVKKDNSNKELTLVHPKNYNLSTTKAGNGIGFSDKESMNQYFNDHCIEESMLNNGSGFFMLLLLLILVIIIVIIVSSVGNGKGSTTSAGLGIGGSGFGGYYF